MAAQGAMGTRNRMPFHPRATPTHPDSLRWGRVNKPASCTALGCGSPRRRPTQTWGGCANSTTTVTLPGSNAFSYQHYNKMTWNKMTLFKHLLYLFIHSPVSGDLGFYLFSCYYQSCCCEHSCLTLTRVKASRERIPVSELVGHSGLDEPGGAAVTDISGDSVYVSLMLYIQCGSAGVSSHGRHSKMA